MRVLGKSTGVEEKKKKLHLDRPTLAREKVGKFSNHSKCGESSSAPKRVSADPLSLCHVTYSSTVLSRVYSVKDLLLRTIAPVW